MKWICVGQYSIGEGKEGWQIGKRTLNESSVNVELTEHIQNSTIAYEVHSNDSYTVRVGYKESSECSSDVWNIKGNKNGNIDSSLPNVRVNERLRDILLRECLNVVQLAAECCRLDEMIFLVKSGENINVRYENGWTLYHLAILMFDNSYLRRLEEPTVRKDRHQCPPRAKLRTNCSYELLQRLLSVGADGNAADVSGRTALHLAVVARHEHAVRLLVGNGIFLDSTDIHQRTALHFAVLGDNLPCVRLLMSRGSRVTIRDEEGNNPLHLAVGENNTEITEVILSTDKRGLNWRNIKGLTPLHIAASLGNELIFNNLIKNHANPRLLDERHETILHKAVRGSHARICEFICQNTTVDVNIKNDLGQTALHLATLMITQLNKNDMLSIIKVLSGNGADPGIKDNEGNSYLTMATKHPVLLDIYLNALPKNIDTYLISGEPLLHRVVKMCCFKCFEVLLGLGANPLITNGKGETLLHIATDLGGIEWVQTIINSTNIDINSKNIYDQTALHCALEARNDRLADLLLSEGSDPYIADSNGRTALHYASTYASPYFIVEKILNVSSSGIDMRDELGNTALLSAADRGLLKNVEVLLESGANPLLANDENQTMLHLAAVHDGEEWLQTILNCKTINVNSKNNEGQTALHLALMTGNAPSAEFLLSKGSDPYIADDYGQTALHYASTFASPYIILEKILNASTSGIDMRDQSGNTALLSALNNGKIKKVEILLQRGASPHLANDNNETLLHLAAFHDGAELLQTVLNSTDIGIASENIYGETALNYAVKAGNYRGVDFLLSKGSDPYIANEFGQTSLHYASLYSSPLMIEKILNKSTSGIDIRDNMGNTALLTAMVHYREENIGILLDRGANPLLANKDNKTILLLAITRGNVEVLELLVNKTSININAPILNGMTPISKAFEAGVPKIVDFLISFNASLCSKDDRGLTLLHKVPFYSEDIGTNIINTILDKCEGILNAEDEEGDTALAAALRAGNVEVFKILRDKGANTTLPHGRALLHLAATSQSIDLVRTLLDEGDADVNVKDDYGNTPLMYATGSGHREVMELLLHRNADPLIENNVDMSPMMVVAAKGDVVLYGLFSRFPADPEQLLGVAMHNGYFESMKIFVLEALKARKNADLHIAAIQGDNEQITELLLKKSELYKRKLPKMMYEYIKDYLILVEEVEQEDNLSGYNYGLTPLEMAILFSGNLDSVRILDNYERNNYIRIPKSIWDPSDLAVFSADLKIIGYFFEGNPQVAKRADKYGWTAMHKAAWAFGFETIDYFHEIGADIDKKDNYGRTPLHVAAMRLSFLTVERILRISNASVNERDKYHFTALHMATIYAHPKFFEKLSKISITTPGRLRYSIKDYGLNSLAEGHLYVMKMLLEAKADPNVQDVAFGWTALHWAAANGDLKAAKLLLENGASVNLPSRSGQTPMYVARFWERKNVYEFLKNNNGVW